jgi:hypothetical protein
MFTVFNLVVKNGRQLLVTENQPVLSETKNNWDWSIQNAEESA